MEGIDDLLQDSFEEGHSSEDDDATEEKHSNLLSVISGLGKDKNKIRKNVVPVKTVTETAAPGGGKPVTVGNLLKTLTDKAIHANIKKAVSKETKHLKTLATPLEKPQNEKITRVAAYDKVKKEVGRWDPIVYQNRQSTEVQEFPLYQPDNRLVTADQFAKKFKPKTPLEEQIAALLHGSKNVLKNGEELTEAEKLALSSMSLKEALERRRELGRIRALQSYQEAKARRQNKIKSKKYHRLLKREKLKKQLKDFEELQKTDPEAALEKLQEIELQRIEERASLRHKNSGKWAKSQAIRSKYNTEARKALSEQLEIGRKLKEKVKESESSEDEEEIPVEIAPKSKAREVNNPWLTKPVAPTVAESVDEPTVGYKKFWTVVNSEKEKSGDLEEIFKDVDEKVQENLKRKAEELLESSDSEVEIEQGNDDNEVEKIEAVLPLRGEGKAVRVRLDDQLEERTGDNQETEQVTKVRSVKKSAKPSVPEATAGRVEIDPTKFMVLETKKIASAINEVLIHGDDEDEIDDQSQRMTIAEAFADDDVLAEFSEEKKKTVDESKPKDIDLFLPGWGSWGGEGVKVNKRKRKRFIIKAPPVPQRKDQNTGNLIINEEKNDKVRSHQVSELPFPFTNVQDFESSIRAPITRTFVPETAHKKLIEPKIRTKLGQAIKPMDERSLPKNKRKRKDVDFDEGLK